MSFKDAREEWYDAEKKVSVVFADVTSAAQELARGHLSGPVSTHFLAKGLAAAALLGAETGEEDETVILQMKCKGPLGGLTAECTSKGTLRGYTDRKLLDDFDGLGKPDGKKVLGERQLQVTRSVPGKILSQGISNSLDGYLAGSLQRKAVILSDAEVTDDVEVLMARGILVEALPDSAVKLSDFPELMDPKKKLSLGASPRNILKKLGLEKAGLKKTTPLSFACRCSAERAQAMLAALGEDERKALPETIDVTCHMCGKTWTVRTR